MTLSRKGNKTIGLFLGLVAEPRLPTNPANFVLANFLPENNTTTCITTTCTTAIFKDETHHFL
jgi:hypothetical protein